MKEHFGDIQKRVLFRSILSMANDREFWYLSKIQHKGHPHYSFGNKISGYTLTDNCYLITEEAKSILERRGVDLSVPLSKHRIGKMKDENGKKQFIYEHQIPNIVKVELIKEVVDREGGISEETLKNILEYGRITIMTQDEDKKINLNKLRNSIPIGCDPNTNPCLRYETSGITLSNVVIKMKGENSR